MGGRWLGCVCSGRAGGRWSRMCPRFWSDTPKCASAIAAACGISGALGGRCRWGRCWSAGHHRRARGCGARMTGGCSICSTRCADRPRAAGPAWRWRWRRGGRACGDPRAGMPCFQSTCGCRSARCASPGAAAA